MWILPLEQRSPGVGIRPMTEHLGYCRLLNEQSFKEKKGGNDGKVVDHSDSRVR
jgi:hypothetical protein